MHVMHHGIYCLSHTYFYGFKSKSFLSQASYFYDVERPSFIGKSKIIIKIKKQTKNKQKKQTK